MLRSLHRRAPRRLLGVLAGAAAIAAVALPSTALATEPRTRLGGSVAVSTAPSPDAVSTFHVSPELYARRRVLPALTLSVDWGVSFTSIAIDGGETFRHFGMGNPLFAAHYEVHESRRIALRAGLGVAAPLAIRGLTRPCCGIRASVAEDYNYTTAAAVRGLAAPWSWATNTLSFVLPIHAEARLGEAVRVGADVAAGALLPITEPLSQTSFAVVTAVDVSYSIGAMAPGVRICAASFTKSVAYDDFAQFSIEPFIQTDVDAGFIRVGIPLSLDAPLGVGEEAGVWALRAGGGVAF